MHKLCAGVDGASLAIFRIAFGATMVWEVARYLSNDWVRSYYITPGFHFAYYGFTWVQPWQGDGMVLHFYALGVLAAALALGALYRIAALLFLFGFAYVFLLEQARYLNHFYLICLLAFLMCLVPAHRTWSVDARRARPPDAGHVPAWSVWILRFQLGIAYFYAGVAKLNHDWISGEPLRSWMAARADLPVIGPFLIREPVVYLFTYGALAFDLSITPLLLWKRSRPFAFAVACAFHLLNSQLFTIGIFPWLMIAATAVFFEPDWPREVIRRLRNATRPHPVLHPVRGSVPGPALAAVLIVFVAAQVLIPLRHWAYPGDVNWTEEGHRFSWRMKLRDKAGDIRFLFTDPASGETWEPRWSDLLASWQTREMATRPDMILQFAHHLARLERLRSGRDVHVRAIARVSLNHRPPQLLVDPTVNLATVPRDLLPAPWILPLDTNPQAAQADVRQR